MRLRRNKAFWVHPDTHDIFKFFPHNPPERGDTVLIKPKGSKEIGERHKVVRCPIVWFEPTDDGCPWEMKDPRGVKVRPIE